MITVTGSYPEKVDITNCDREPIHIIGKAQPHGVIIGCSRADFQITRCSENSEHLLGISAKDLLKRPLSTLFSEEDIDAIKSLGEKEKIALSDTVFENRRYLKIAHVSGDEYIVDIEPVAKSANSKDLREQLTNILNDLSSAPSIEEIANRTVKIVKKVFTYDRVMLYRFDEEWNGEVVAEEKERALESWLGLHYPATDIPKPSRELFLKQGVRMISDVHHTPAAILPSESSDNSKPLDLSGSELRGVSPIHIQYLINMKVGASLTAAIVLNGELWGLLACHHYSSKFIDYHQRQLVKFLTQVITNRLALLNANIFLENTGKSEEIRKELVNQMQKLPVSQALNGNTKFTDLLKCDGGAVFQDKNLELSGITPSKEEVLDLIQNFLTLKKDKLFYTKNLCKLFSNACSYKEKASGVLAVKLGDQNEDMVIWFRQEVIQTVSWGGNPEKNAIIKDGIIHLTPRKSFEKWSQKLSGVSLSWEKYEVEAALSLEESITYAIVQRQKEEILELNKNLSLLNEELEIFNYNVSHDLRAPLRGIEGYARILEEDYLKDLDEYGKKVLKTIISSADKMEHFINDLLNLAKLGRTGLKIVNIPVPEMLQEIKDYLNVAYHYPSAEIIVDDNIPEITGDKNLIFQLLSNLIENALKYSDKVSKPRVEIGFYLDNDNAVYLVKDNGIGFNPDLKEKIFNSFTRLVKEEYPGTGIGLAIAKKVILKHNGKIWVDSTPGEGSVFYFILNSH